MKLRVTMKDPDTLCEAILDAVDAEVSALPLSSDEGAAVAEARRAAIGAVAAKWFKWGEYLTVEIDTDAGTAIVCDAE